jgi:phosphatidate cytidylyltransferase
MASVGLVAMRDGPSGFWIVLWLILVVVATDIGGYFAGRFIGGPKLWVKISPKKTWSGTIGGWVLAVVVSGAFAVWMGWNLPLLAVVALVLSVASQAGDLAESAVKRAVGIKDSGFLIPGHGGLLDRFDGLMGASMVATIFGLTGYIH